MENFLLKGVLIGILFGIPAGAVGVLTTQRILAYGSKAGIISGMGSSVADCLYAAIGVFGLTFVSDILIKNQLLIFIMGGTWIISLGIKLLKQKAANGMVENKNLNSLKMFLSSFLVGITNPAAILTFLFAFSYFEISEKLHFAEGIQVILGVFIGTTLWWAILAVVVDILQKCKTKNSVTKLNKIFGTILVLFGIVIITKAVRFH